MGLQSRKSPNFENFRIPNLGIRRQNDIWVQALWLGIQNTIKGKVVASPQIRAVVSLMSMCMFVVRLCTKNVPTTH